MPGERTIVVFTAAVLSRYLPESAYIRLLTSSRLASGFHFLPEFYLADVPARYWFPGSEPSIGRSSLSFPVVLRSTLRPRCSFCLPNYLRPPLSPSPPVARPRFAISPFVGAIECRWRLWAHLPEKRMFRGPLRGTRPKQDRTRWVSIEFCREILAVDTIARFVVDQRGELSPIRRGISLVTFERFVF